MQPPHHRPSTTRPLPAPRLRGLKTLLQARLKSPLRSVWPAATLALALLSAGCASLGVPPPTDTASAVAAATPDTVAAAPEQPGQTGEPSRTLPAAPPAVPSGSAALPLLADEGPAATLADPLPDPVQARLDLWQRVRGGFALQGLDSTLVHKWEQHYATRPDYVERMALRGGRYLYHIMEEVERRQMPAELALLPFIESAFNPQALSHAKASGMWQFMPATGKDFALRQNLFRDDRRDVLASTRAALDYLQRLHGLFGDWHLALAAYNWGQGNVQRALDRNRRAGKPLDYAHLVMPDETRNYVPKLLAVKHIVADPGAFALTLPPLDNHPYFLSVNIQRDIDVALAASLAGLPLAEFQMLNPQHNKPVILAAGTPQVLLPYDNAERFVQALAGVRKPLASWTAWVAPRTLKPAEAARLVGMDEAALREVNRIPPRMLVRAGSTLLVPRAAHSTADVAEHIADNGMIAFAPEGRPLRRLAFKAGRKGDTLAAVARRNGLAPSTLARLNKLPTGARFAPGQAVVLNLPPKPQARTRVAARKPAAASGKARQVAKATPAKLQAKAKGKGKATAKAPSGAGKRVRVAQR